MKLSNNFSLSEFTETSTGLPNKPSQEAVNNLKYLVQYVLQPARDKFGPIEITSGYRSEKVNASVGGSATSDHLYGKAADIKHGDLASVFEFLRKQTHFKQLIWEFGTDSQPAWIHVSYDVNNNKGEVLKAIKKNGKTKYIQF